MGPMQEDDDDTIERQRRETRSTTNERECAVSVRCRARQAEPDNGQSETSRARQAERNKQSETGRARQAQPYR